MELGKQYNLKIEDEEQFEKLMMDTDFQNRSVLKIITTCQLESLMSEEDPKAENIMNNIYIGKEATKCDGNIYGISTFMHIIIAKPKKPDDNSLFIPMITADFKYKTDVDYTIKHRYR